MPIHKLPVFVQQRPAEGRNLARMPNPQHSETERLDHGPNWLKHTEDGLLLGECRFKAFISLAAIVIQTR